MNEGSFIVQECPGFTNPVCCSIFCFASSKGLSHQVVLSQLKRGVSQEVLGGWMSVLCQYQLTLLGVFSCNIPHVSSWFAIMSTKGQILGSSTVASTCHSPVLGKRLHEADKTPSWEALYSSARCFMRLAASAVPWACRPQALLGRDCLSLHACAVLWSCLVPLGYHRIDQFSCNWWERF